MKLSAVGVHTLLTTLPILGTWNFRDFNSLSWNLGTENIDAFVMDWHGENSYICSLVFLIRKVLRHMMNCQAVGSVIVPFWPSVIFWPLWMEYPTDYNPFAQDTSNKDFFHSGIQIIDVSIMYLKFRHSGF